VSSLFFERQEIRIRFSCSVQIRVICCFATIKMPIPKRNRHFLPFAFNSLYGKLCNIGVVHCLSVEILGAVAKGKHAYINS